MIRRILVAAASALLFFTPTTALACCMAVAAHLAWPWDGMEDVPVDAAILLYGSTYEQPLDEWSVGLAHGNEATVALATSLSMMSDEYFLIVATPEEPLAPDTEYTCTFSRNGIDVEGAEEFSFRTAEPGAEWASPAVPELEYEGLGVPMREADGTWCVSSVTEEDGALALTVSGEGLSDRAILLEARDSQETKVFDTVLSGDYDLDRQLILGGGLCSAHFDVNPCEHYCVRVAALDHHGELGPWSEWSCTDEIGDWVCGDPEGSVLFGDDIEEGKTLPPDVQLCLEGGPWEPEADARDEEEPDLPESGAYAADEDSDSGCALASSPQADPLGLVLLALLVMFPAAIPRRRRSRRVASVVALGFLLGFLVGCDSKSGETDESGQDASVDAMAGDDATGLEVESDASLSEETNADKASPGDPEFAAYCQGIVDAFRQLYEDLELPDNLAQENPPPVKTGEEFDPNIFFTVLDRLHMEEGWSLDFTYFYNELGGEPTLVARAAGSPLCQSDPEQPCVSEGFLLHVLVDGTREGWFQLMVLKLMGDQFYREWHGFEGKVILPSQAGLNAWLEEQKKRWSIQDGEDFDEAAMAALQVDPMVDVGEESVHVSIVYFSRGSGVVRWITDISLAPPYSKTPGGENSHETLFECTWCGVP